MGLRSVRLHLLMSTYQISVRCSTAISVRTILSILQPANHTIQTQQMHPSGVDDCFVLLCCISRENTSRIAGRERWIWASTTTTAHTAHSIHEACRLYNATGSLQYRLVAAEYSTANLYFWNLNAWTPYLNVHLVATQYRCTARTWCTCTSELIQ